MTAAAQQISFIETESAPAATPVTPIRTTRPTIPCPACKGEGQVPFEKGPCEACGGAKTVEAPIAEGERAKMLRLGRALVSYRDAVRDRSRYVHGWVSAAEASRDRATIDAETSAGRELLDAMRDLLPDELADELRTVKL